MRSYILHTTWHACILHTTWHACILGMRHMSCMHTSYRACVAWCYLSPGTAAMTASAAVREKLTVTKYLSDVNLIIIYLSNIYLCRNEFHANMNMKIIKNIFIQLKITYSIRNFSIFKLLFWFIIGHQFSRHVQSFCPSFATGPILMPIFAVIRRSFISE